MNRARWVGPGRLVLTTAAAAGIVAWATVSPVVGSGADASGRGPAAAALAPVTSAALSCPGPELSGVEGVDDAEVSARIGAAAAPPGVIAPLAPSGRGELVVRSGKSTSPKLTARGSTATVPLSGAAAVDVSARGSLAPGVAATQEWAATGSELRGLATVPCTAPGSDLWLLAGGGDAGRQERLVLTNPGANEVTVDVEAYGLEGPLASPTGSTVVPAGGRVALLADAVTGDEESPAIRVRANGGSIRAVLTDTWLDGSVPAGAETTVPTAAPSTRQVIPAALVTSGASIRIAVPGPAQAVVSARLVGKDGVTPLPGGGVARVGARSTGELAVPKLVQDLYAVEVTSDVPIVASLFASWRKGDNAGDFMWAPSTEPSAGLLGSAFPADEEPRRRFLGIVATGGPASVSVTSRSGTSWTTKVVTLPADSSSSMELGDAESVWVRRTSGAGQVRAGIGTLMGETGLVSASPLAQSTVTSAVSRAHPAP